MGGVDVGEGGGKKRATNSDINMIPFIDLLMVTIAFLLITAVWTTNSRINADAQVPGPPDPNKELTPQTPEKVLNLHVGDSEFVSKKLTVAKTYDRFFDGVDFAEVGSLAQADIDALLTDTLNHQTAAFIGTAKPN